MAYVVLARKYRPRSFAQMVGQEHVVQALSNALTQGRLHHAYLFTGTRGIGKTTVSRILAKSLNCTGPDGTGGITAEPCGVCQACTEIDADRFIDYIELDAASNRGIDEVRDMIERAAYKPGVGRFKVFMIDEAHQLTKEAFNALLKTLEEPPDYLKFVLATTDPEKMLPTVLSRCLQFNLRPMAPQTVREHLQRVLTAENVPFDDGSLALLGRAARGSMRDGLSLTDQAIAYGGGQLSQAVVRTMLGSVDRGHTLALVQALSANDGTAVLAVVDALRGQGLSAAATLDELALLLQQMAVQQVVPGALDEQDPDTADARLAAPLLAPDETQLLYSMALQGREELGLVSDEYAGLAMVMLRFLAFSPQGPAAAPAPREVRAAPLRAPAPPAATLPVAPRAAPSSAPTPAPTPPQAHHSIDQKQPQPGSASAVADTSLADASWAGTAKAAGLPAYQPLPVDTVQQTPGRYAPAAPAATSAVTSALSGPSVPHPAHKAGAPVPSEAGLGERWDACFKALCEQGAVAALVKELASQAGLRHIEHSGSGPQRWCLVVAREPLRSPVLADKLAAALSALLGEPVVLELEAGTPQDSPALRDAAERQRRQDAAEASIRQDPVVLELLSQFKGAQIVPGSIRPL